MKTKIGIASDHAGYEYKTKLVSYLKRKGFEVVDFGTNSTDSCDYPDYAHPLALAVEGGKVEKGIAICGTGNGMAFTLNKHQGIRAGLAWAPEIATLVKQHNNANILVMPARFASYRTCCKMVNCWLDAEFEPRHQRRLDKVAVK